MSGQSLEILPGQSVPNFTRLIIRPSDKLSPIFIERAVGQRILMSLQFLIKLEILMLIRSYSNNELLYQTYQVMFFAWRDQRLLV